MQAIRITDGLKNEVLELWDETFNDTMPNLSDYAGLVGGMPLVKTLHSGLVNCALGMSGEYEEYLESRDTLAAESEQLSELGDVWWYAVQAWCTIDTYSTIGFGGQNAVNSPGPYSERGNREKKMHKLIGRFSELTKKVVVHNRPFAKYEEEMRETLRSIFYILDLEAGFNSQYVWAYNIVKLCDRYGYVPATSPRWTILNPKESV